MSTILIAEDNRLTMMIYKKIISYLGHEIIPCFNGLDALNTIKERKVDLAILDYMMPEMDGLEACREIRKTPNGISIPIIIVSANDSQEEILNCLNAGANDYLVKPIKEPILIAKLKNFLKTSSLHKNEIEIVKNKVAIADRYKVEKILGYGTHSIVFLAFDTANNDKKVAVKLLNQNILTEELANSFIELSANLQKAKLKNVIEIIDFGQYNGHIFIVLEFAESGDFASILKQKEKLDEVEVLKMLLDITEAFISMEEQNINHLDIKPENILICENGTHKLTDFGIIKEETNATMSIKSEIWSTASYAPPEIFLEQNKISIKSDVYSLGVTAYMALTGDNPFFAEKSSVAMFRQINLKPTSILQLEIECSLELSLIIDMMLSKVPEQRPTPLDLKETLTYIQNCFETGDVDSLTYIEKTNLTKTLQPEEIEKQTQNIAHAVENLNNQKTSSLTLKNIKSKKKKVKKARQKRKKKPIIIPSLYKILIPIFIATMLYLALIFAQKLMEGEKEKFNFKGIKSALECANCGNLEIKEVIDITEDKCPKCGGQEWFAYICNNCEKIFPWDEDKLDQKAEELEKSGKENDDSLYVCPYCQSSDISPLPWERIELLHSKQ